MNKQLELHKQRELIIKDTKKYIEKFQNIEKKYIDYKHDILHEIANISHCLEMNDTSKIKESINRIVNLDKEKNLNFFSNNLYINSLMKSKVEDNPDICFDIDIKISSSLQEEIIDVCVVLSNTIDQYCELIHSNHLEKKLKLKCIQKNDMFIMFFSSLYKSNINNMNISENANRITMIKKIVNEKNGSMQMKNSKNSYTIEIIMNL